MIRKQDLGRLEFIAEGAVGRVYRAPDFHLPECPDIAYKEIMPVGAGLTVEQRQHALGSMRRSATFRSQLPPVDRADLDAYTTWPIDMVEVDGEPSGCIMPLIPPDFFLTARPPGGTPHDLVFELSWLCAKDSHAARIGVDRSGVRDTTVRITLLALLVYAVGRLHKHGVVYGDVSLKNAALAVDPPRVRLLDCDAVAELSDPHRKQMHSPFFVPPEGVADKGAQQDKRTDVYKLALCIIRGLQQGQGVTQAKNPSVLAGMLDPATIDTLTRAVDADPAVRPTAKDLFECLERNLLAKAVAPELISARLSRTTMPRGTDVEVVWESTGGTDVRIQDTNGGVVVLPDSGAAVSRHVLTPTVSGEITVEVRNGHGSDRMVAGAVLLFDLPTFHLDMAGRLPRPEIGRLPAVTLPTAQHSFPPIPTVSTAGHEVPRIVPPPMEPVVEAISVMREVLPPPERLTAIHAPAMEFAGQLRRSLDPSISGAPLGSVAAEAVAATRAVLDEAWDLLRERADQELRAQHQGKAVTP